MTWPIVRHILQPFPCTNCQRGLWGTKIEALRCGQVSVPTRTSNRERSNRHTPICHQRATKVVATTLFNVFWKSQRISQHTHTHRGREMYRERDRVREEGYKVCVWAVSCVLYEIGMKKKEQ